MNPSFRRCETVAGLLLPFALAWLALPPKAQAICQQGCDLILENTFLGNNALSSNTTGYDDTAVGSDALSNNTNGIFNTAIGRLALSNNTDGFYNTAIGMSALFSNTTASYNTATGTFALISNTVGASNTVTGSFALQSNTTGSDNSVTGSFALRSNTTGSDNTATGRGSLSHSTTGSRNTADGREALRNNKTGNGNIAVGFSAGSALTTGDNNIDVGNAGVADEANIVRIGKLGTQTATFIAGISGAVVPDGVGVIVGTDGKLGTVVSSERYKDAIKPMDKASEAILSLQPVTFRYKHDFDPDGIPQFGLVAEQVAKVNPDLVARDDQGKPYTVRYEAVNAMLLNEFLKEHRKVEEQQTALDQLKSKVAQQEDLRSIVAQQQIEIAALTSQIQKVSERLAVVKPAPRIVSNKE
ncbi:MAG: tail fiber domain-containing protein [Chthoniobacterales bacterium]|nr:tail fiber domain-containing protein [Chthoniobacterales bacterium]